jgi:predicted nucleic acid-binding protein
MTVVVDANVAVKWFIEQHGSDDARRVQAYRGPLIAPSGLISETTTDFGATPCAAMPRRR